MVSELANGNSGEPHVPFRVNRGDGASGGGVPDVNGAGCTAILGLAILGPAILGSAILG